MRPIRVSRQLVAAAVGAVCASQTPGGAGNLLINGTLAAGGVATLDVQRNIGITSLSNLSGLTFVITGTDQQGRAVTESLVGPNNATVTSVLNYLTVTQITISGAAAGALTVDTVATGAGQEIPLNQYLTPFNVSVSLEVASGAGNWTLQYTLDDIFTGTGPYQWYNHNTLTGVTANNNGTIVSPVTAVRVLTNSGNGKLNAMIVQAGVM